MAFQSVAEDARPCVWMEAGVLRYRLCTRGFRCESCPLDSALRGAMGPAGRPHGPLPPPPAGGSFPDDRLYSGGHLWLRGGPRLAAGDGDRGASAPVWRVGLDGFAASILDSVTGVRCPPRGEIVTPGRPLCAIEMGCGTVPVGSPLQARLARVNPILRSRPDTLRWAPYGEGWLVELEAEDPSGPPTPPGLDALVGAEVARHGAALDTKRFRRLLSLHLLSGAAGNEAVGSCVHVDGLRQVVDEASRLELVRSFLY